jgi:hypothetical protein
MHLSGDNKIGNSASAPQPASDCCLRSVQVLIESKFGAKINRSCFLNNYSFIRYPPSETAMKILCTNLVNNGFIYAAFAVISRALR